MRNDGDLETVLRYHERTKHHFNRHARGPGLLDWANQPDPFRRHEGASLVHLPRLGDGEEPLSPAYEGKRGRFQLPASRNVTFQLFDDEFVLGNDGFHHVTDGNDAHQFLSLHDE